ncbi:hypothetical protein [Caulobacter sp. 1776]|uniref:hypothetical protein n=1 Tax=Caulobacter sp. 1776 TaxID=3156420 RepID=UPI003395544A
MSAKPLAPWRRITVVTGSAALASWSVAIAQALPRLAAGPLCSSRDDALTLAGHCPACFLAVAFSLAFLGSLLRTRGQMARAAVRDR